MTNQRPCRTCEKPTTNAGRVCTECQEDEAREQRHCIRCDAATTKGKALTWRRVPGGYLCRSCELDDLVKRANQNAILV